jgi:uncharacterized protein (UPF0218 family)
VTAHPPKQNIKIYQGLDQGIARQKKSAIYVTGQEKLTVLLTVLWES